VNNAVLGNVPQAVGMIQGAINNQTNLANATVGQVTPINNPPVATVLGVFPHPDRIAQTITLTQTSGSQGQTQVTAAGNFTVIMFGHPADLAVMTQTQAVLQANNPGVTVLVSTNPNHNGGNPGTYDLTFQYDQTIKGQVNVTTNTVAVDSSTGQNVPPQP